MAKRAGWKEKVPGPIDLRLDVREFIGRGKGRHGNLSALRSEETREEILASKGAKDCLDYLERQIAQLLLRKENPTVVIGCAKGKHRSVAIATELCRRVPTSEVHYHYAK